MGTDFASPHNCMRPSEMGNYKFPFRSSRDDFAVEGNTQRYKTSAEIGENMNVVSTEEEEEAES